MTSSESIDQDAPRAGSLHREVVQLTVLVAVAVAAFFMTRAVAANNRATSLRDADAWYRHGQAALAAGQTGEAIDAFRRATVRNRTDKSYVLALARALALNRDDDAARSVLLTLRDSAPEDAQINLELARLAVHRDDVTEAVRFYHNTLYAPWPAERLEERRRVRLELIDFLLSHHQSSRALAELVAASADLPDQPQAHLEIAQLFVRAGDNTHALQQFQMAIRLAPHDGAALAGAGRCAFALGNYALARDYLRRAPDEIDDAVTVREVTELVLSRDPLASRIGATERRRRLIADLAYTQKRLADCAAQSRLGGSNATALQQEVDDFVHQTDGTAPLGQDTIESGVDLMYRVAQWVTDSCHSATAQDRALLLIGRQHGGDSR